MFDRLCLFFTSINLIFMKGEINFIFPKGKPLQIIKRVLQDLFYIKCQHLFTKNSSKLSLLHTLKPYEGKATYLYLPNLRVYVHT